MPSRPSERVVLLVLAAIQFTHIMDFMVMMPLAPQSMRELAAEKEDHDRADRRRSTQFIVSRCPVSPGEPRSA